VIHQFVFGADAHGFSCNRMQTTFQYLQAPLHPLPDLDRTGKCSCTGIFIRKTAHRMQTGDQCSAGLYRRQHCRRFGTAAMKHNIAGAQYLTVCQLLRDCRNLIIADTQHPQ
jgi:hypothetical protein